MMKKILKTIAALGVSLACLCGGAVNAVAATSYNSCDTNRDGVVNGVDLLLSFKCMKGLEYVNNPAVLDADGNRIVSAVDTAIVNDYTMLCSAYTKVEGASGKYIPYTTTAMSVAGATMSQQYVRHTYATDRNMTYTLTTAESTVGTNEDQPSTYAVIGPDERKKDAMDGVVWLSSGSTGFIIDDYTIVTAAHCVYAKNRYENGVLVEPAHWIPDMKISLSDSNGRIDRNQSFTAVEAHIPSNYLTSSNTMYDYALIRVEEDLSEHCTFNLGMTYDIYNSSYFRNYSIYVTGFPQYIPGYDEKGNPNKNTTPWQMYTGEGFICQGTNVDKNLWCYTSDTTPGNSGGPVYVKEKVYVNGKVTEYNTAISIHHGGASALGYNCGPIINAIMMKFYYSNPYAY